MSQDSSRFVALSPVEVANVLAETSLYSLHEKFSLTLKECLRSVNKNGSQDTSSARIFAGLGGISYLNFHLSTTPGPITPDSRAKLLSISHQQLSDSLASSHHALSIPTSGSKVAFLDTSTGPATLILLYQLHHFASLSSTSTAKNKGLPPFDKSTVTSAANVLFAATIVALQPVAAAELPEDGCELLYGRAGLLHALLLLHQAYHSTHAADHLADGNTLHGQVASAVKQLIGHLILKKLADDLIQRGRIGAEIYSDDHKKALKESEICPSLMWCWHGQRYLGGAHGIAGILQVLLHLPQDIITPHFKAIMQTTSWLISMQDPQTGNWPPRPSKAESLIQWCHGASGIIPLLATLVQLHIAAFSPLSIEPDLLHAILDSMEKASTLIMTIGLLRKGPGLCHGVAGNAIALFYAADVFAAYHRSSLSSAASPGVSSESAARVGVDGKNYAMLADECTTGALHHLRSYMDLDTTLHSEDTSIHSPESTKTRVFRTPDRPWSLYEGYGGLCAVLGEALRRLDELITLGRSAKLETKDGYDGGQADTQKTSNVLLGCGDLLIGA